MHGTVINIKQYYLRLHAIFYLFISYLFNDAASKLESVASSEKVICQ
jgi:hypothetical protein